MSAPEPISADTSLAPLLESMIEIGLRAGEMGLPFFHQGERTSAGVTSKAGGSPVTEADMLIDRFLKEELSRLVPESGWLSEETADSSERLGKRQIFVVDPIDGTRAFVTGDPRWGVSIAFVIDDRPVAAVLHMPALAETFSATNGGGAFRNGARIKAMGRVDAGGASIAGPMSVVRPLINVGAELVPQPRVPSLAYRFALVAAGALDLAVASIDANDWDIAASDLLLQESGAILSGLDGAPLKYNQHIIKHDILVAAPLSLHAGILRLLHRAQDRVS